MDQLTILSKNGKTAKKSTVFLHSFNFWNFSIYKLQSYFGELKSLKIQSLDINTDVDDMITKLI